MRDEHEIADTLILMGERIRELESTLAKIPDHAYHAGMLKSLVVDMLENSPDDLAADAGVTVLDVWRKRAKQILKEIDR